MRPIWIGPDSPQRIKDSDKKWAEGAESINVVVYDLFLIKKEFIIERFFTKQAI